MNAAPYCICTVVSTKALEAILDNASPSGRRQQGGAYKDTHPWHVARELLAEARAAQLSLVVVFASGDPLEFVYWAEIKDIDVEEFHRNTWETRCEFAPLNPVNEIFRPVDSIALYPSKEQLHREAIEPVTMHRQYLDQNLIRPYAIGETPAFIGEATRG